MNTIYHLSLLPWLVCLARSELHGCTEDILVRMESSDPCDAEKLVRGATEATEVMVFARPDQMPADQITGTVEHGSHITLAEETTLNDTINRFENVGCIQFEWASCVKTLNPSRLWCGEIKNSIAIVHSKGFWVGVEV